MPRTLIAGFGNVLRGDDGFGVEVVHRLEARVEAGEPLGDDVHLLEVGTGGLHLAQQLLAGYDRLIIVDAMARGGTPGDVYVLRIDGVEAPNRIDLHLAIPARALSVAKALGALPAETVMIGCEPAEVNELSMGLSPRVLEGVHVAIERIEELLGLSAGASRGEPQ